MSKEVIEQWTRLSRATLDAYKELGEINTRFYTRVFNQQLDALNLALEVGVRHLSLTAEPARNPREFLDKETALLGEVNEQFLGVARQTSEILVETGNELGAWAERGIRTAAQQVQQVQQTVKQAATPRKAAA